MIKKLILTTFIASSPILSMASWQKRCADLSGCLKYFASLTNQTYSFQKNEKISIYSNRPENLSESEAEIFLTEILSLNGLSRIKSGDNHFKIVSSRDVRYEDLEKIKVDPETDLSQIPATHDYKQFVIKLKHHNSTELLARNLRPFLSRYARIIDLPLQKTIILSEKSYKAASLIGTIRSLDIEIDEDQWTKIQERRNRRTKHQCQSQQSNQISGG